MRIVRALTLLEMLVVIAITALLIAILLPALGSHCGPPARITRCATNLKQQGNLFALLLAQNSNRAPASNGAFSSLCDQSLAFRDALVNANPPPAAAASARIFYCAMNTRQDPAILWQHGGVSTWGYAWLNSRDGAGSLPSTFPFRDPPLSYRATLEGRASSMSELALDVIVSDAAVGNMNWSPASGAIAFGTNHLSVATPQGANVLCLDMHVEWRKFSQGKATAIQTGGQRLWIPQP
ncbi:MAG TPA: hypothetical protein VHM90_08040 [Phycisphaerae bacterium]|jgi:hypothetical protein|nr:hypothetical protein [Phycisphaerae bacterium]